MPTYAYACTTCEHRFEVHQAFSDTSLTDCPECSGRLRKLFNTVGIVFKGSGFYRTDSRAEPRPGEAGGSKESSESSKVAANGSGDGASGTPSKDASNGSSDSASNGSSKSGAGKDKSSGSKDSGSGAGPSRRGAPAGAAAKGSAA